MVVPATAAPLAPCARMEEAVAAAVVCCHLLRRRFHIILLRFLRRRPTDVHAQRLPLDWAGTHGFVFRYDENVQRKSDLVLLVLRVTPRIKQLGLLLRWRRPSLRGGSLIIDKFEKSAVNYVLCIYYIISTK